MRALLAILMLIAAVATKAQPMMPTAPKAARTVHLVHDAVEGDMYYTEMRIDEAQDNSFFVPIGWQNGYFGLQQFDGENKRALNFAVWNLEDTNTGVSPTNEVEVVYTNPTVVIKRLTGKGGGVQCMRQMNWREGKGYKFTIQAQVQTNLTAYTAWLYDEVTGRWERLATFRAITGGQWLRGYYSFIEDFRRDGRSAQETRRARLSSIWVHQYEGPWVRVKQAMFTVSTGRTENKDAVDAWQGGGAFFLATGGSVQKRQKIGGLVELSDVPMREPKQPDLWFLYEKPKL